MKRVLILTVTAGMGHNSTAKSISDELENRGIATKTIDVYKYISKIISETIDKSTTIYSKVTPDLYRMIYEYLDKGNIDERLNILGLINGICSLKFERLLATYNPDVIICTHVFAAQIMDDAKRRGKSFAKLVGIITDYTIHPYWETVMTLDYCIIANERLRYRAVKKGIPTEKIKALGIPINPKFLIPVSKEQAREDLGLPMDKKIMLIMGGGLGLGFDVENIDKILSSINDAHIMIVCGKSKKMYHRLQSYNEKTHSDRLHIYGYVDNIHIMMSAADILISKPGGVSISEAFAKRLPMVIINPLAGQEERNAEFMMNCGLAMFANKNFPLDEAVYIMLYDDVIGERIKENIKNIIIDNSTVKICDFISGLIK